MSATVVASGEFIMMLLHGHSQVTATMREGSQAERKKRCSTQTHAKIRKNFKFDGCDNGSTTMSYDDVRSPVKHNIPQRKQQGRAQSGNNRKLLIIQNYALFKADLDDDCPLAQIVDHWNRFILKFLLGRMAYDAELACSINCYHFTKDQVQDMETTTDMVQELNQDLETIPIETVTAITALIFKKGRKKKRKVASVLSSRKF